MYILKGAAGSGKSDAVKAYVAGNPAHVKRRRFREIVSGAVVESWLKEAWEKQQELFLDAFDEHQQGFSVEFLYEPLAEAAQAGQCPRIRIVSRSVQLPEGFVKKLSGSCGKEPEQCQSYSIYPLRPNEIEVWGRNRLGDKAPGFFQEVDAKNLRGDLKRPADLEAFISVYAADESLGPSRREAWRRSVEIQLTEENPDRERGLRTNVASRFGAPERYRCAQFLAGIDSIAQRFPILLGKQLESAESGIREVELYEAFKEVVPELSSPDFGSLLRETLDTRLFEKDGKAVVFESAMKSQFLAAEFVSSLPVSEIINLLKDGVTGRRVAKNAQVIAAELASFQPEIFDWICEHDPETLLKGLGTEYSEDEKRRAVEALLLKEDRDYRAHYSWALQVLKHERLGDQIRPYLARTKSDDIRCHLAIDLAEFCGCKEVLDELALLAIDSSLNIDLRVDAAHALAELDKSGERLRPLLDVPDVDDPAEDLYGCVMIGLWPHGFEPTEAFAQLRLPKMRTSGLYHGFLT
jgi:hypothetical protein